MAFASVAQVLARELGTVGAGGPGSTGAWEEVPELRFPYSQLVYDRMRRTWSQGEAMVSSATMPILGTQWRLAGRRVRPQVMELCQREIGLMRDEDGRIRPREGGVVWDDFLRHAMLHGPLGFMPMELVTEPGPADPEWTGRAEKPIVQHLKKIDPRFPRTLAEPPIVNEQGDLVGIKQYVFRADPVTGHKRWVIVDIPASSLVMLVNQREGADYLGKSWLRSAYKHWLITDMMYRVGALAVDRTGMGLPVVTYPKDGSKQLALDIASAVRSGEDSGVALEEGYTLELVGVTGSVADPVKQINLHDQAAGRGMMQMFLNLGHDGGLGQAGVAETFLDFFLMSERAIVRYLEEVVTEQILRRIVEWNYGPDEPYPTLVGDDPSVGTPGVAEAIANLADAGLVHSDGALRGELRRQLGLPPEGPDAVQVSRASRQPAVVPPGVPGQTGAPGLPPATVGGAPIVDRAGRPLAIGMSAGVLQPGGVQQAVVEAVGLLGADGVPLVTVRLAGGPAVTVPTAYVQALSAPHSPADPRLLAPAQLAAHARALADRLELAPA